MVDEKDWEILRELRKDCRLSYREMGKRVNMATGTVHNRIKKLEREGIIQHYHAELDFAKLGYPIAAIIAVMARRDKLLFLKKRLSEHPNIFGFFEVAGEYDVFLGARFKNVEELSEFIRKELTPKVIERTTTFLVLHTGKEHHTLMG